MANEVAVDRFVAHDALDRVDRRVVGVVPGARALHADLGSDLGIVDRQAVVDVAAVAPGGFGSDALTGFQHDDRRAPPCQRERRRQPGEAAADDRDVALRRQLRRARHEGRRGGGPVRLELHVGAG